MSTKQLRYQKGGGNYNSNRKEKTVWDDDLTIRSVTNSSITSENLFGESSLQSSKEASGSLSITTSSLASDGIASLTNIRRITPNTSAVDRANILRSRASSRNLLISEVDDLIGRDKEISQLKSCVDRTTRQTEKYDTSHSKDLVFISGESGTGKTVLVKTLEDEVSKRKGGIFGGGKFEMNASDKPFSGVSEAFCKICQHIKENLKDRIPKIRDSIHKYLGNEAIRLIYLIPELKDILGYASFERMPSLEALESGLVDQMRYAFRVLTRVLSNECSPMVLFLDDLQWADVSSLQVLDHLISDTQNSNPLMIIGCYRSDEVDKNSLLFNKIAALRDKTKSHELQITEMQLHPFDEHDVEMVIEKMIPSGKQDENYKMAILCTKKTLGNPFFVLEFLKMLQEEGLANVDPSSKIWSWDLQQIDDATMSTANVVWLLEERIKKLPEQVQIFLQCAAYLGSTFSRAAVDTVWGSYGRRLVEGKVESTSKLLECSLGSAILELYGDNYYRWVHDKVREVALTMQKVRQSFQLDIGRALYYSLDDAQVENDLFNIVDLINNGNVFKRPEFANVNLRAAEKARGMAALHSAAKYAAHGIGLLEADAWKEKRSLALKLYCIGSEMELAVGNSSAVERYSELVLKQKDLSVSETIPLKMARIRVLMNTEMRFDEALKLCLEVLRDLGCRLAWTKRLAMVEAVSKSFATIWEAKKTPKDFFEKIGKMDDPKHKAIISIIARTAGIAYMAGNHALMLLCICKMVKMTLDHGVSDFSAMSMSTLGMLCIMIQQDYKTGADFAQAGLFLTQKFGGMRKGETFYISYVAILSWVRPFHLLRDPMLEGYAGALRMGECEHAMWCISAYMCLFPYATGMPIREMMEEFPNLVIQLEESAASLQLKGLKVIWQMLLNISEPDAISTMDGKIFCKSENDKEDKHHLANVYLAEGEILLFQGDYEAAAEHAIKMRDNFTKNAPGHLWIVVEAFHRAVALYAVALKTKQRRYKRAARRVRKVISKWARGGNPNVVYYDMLLSAEQAALDKKYEEADKHYNDAIEAVTACNHLHHAGLIYERYSNFLLEERGFEEESRVPLKEAVRYYKEWGAATMVHKLESKLR